MSSACALAPKPGPAAVSQRDKPDCACADELERETGLPRFLGGGAVQAKLDVGAPDDPLEREADEFARAVQQGNRVLPRFLSGERPVSSREPCADCTAGAIDESGGLSGTGRITRRTTRGVTPDDGGGQPPAGAGAGADAASSTAAPLAPSIRTRVEGALGLDLGSVRVHTGPGAERAATALQAKAFTHGSDIWLGARHSPDDLGLMAHEVAHVVQQGGGADGAGAEGDGRIQRAPADYRHPEDGGNVAARMQARMSAAERDEDEGEASEDPAGRAHEARSAISQVDRSEVAAERAEIEPDARPDVDRPAAERPNVEQAQSQTRAEADSPAEPLAEGEGGGGEAGEAAAGEGEAGSAADVAAGLAEQAFADADGASMPGPEPAVLPPAPVTPVDAGGALLPGDPGADERIAGLAAQAQSLREEGTRVRSLAGEERGNAARLEGNLALVRGGVSMAEQGVATSETHLAFRQELAGQAREALAVSEQKAATVAAEAPNFASKADEGKAESGPMAAEAGELAAENAANTPDDPEAAANAREQGGQMNQAGAEIGTTDDAVTRTREKAANLGEDAARAQQTNTETTARLDGMDEQLSATGEKLGAMTAQNAEARAQVETLAAAPQSQRAQAGQLENQGAGLVASSFEIESRLNAIQRDYAQAMQAVPAEEEPEAGAAAGLALAVEPTAEALEPAALPEAEGGVAEGLPAEGVIQRTPDESATPPPPVPVAVPSPVEAPAPAPAPTAEGDVPSPAADETVAAEAVEGADSEAAEGLLPDGPPESAASPPLPPPEPERERVDAAGAVAGALPEWMTGVASPNAEAREAAAAAAEQRRQDEIAEIEAMAEGGFENLSATDKMGIALRMTGRSLFGSVSGIQWPGWGHLALGLVDPRGPLMGVVSGLGTMLSGAASLLSAEQWARDPLGNLLKSAADIATGLTVVLGSITALAGVIIAIMVAITILSFGTAAPVTGPVIAFCTTVLTTVGGWTLAVGKVALVLQALVFIKNLIDAACAETAAELQSESQQMTENVGDAANVLMQMGMAKAGQLGGRAAAAEIRAAGGGVRYAAGMGARAGVTARSGLSAVGRGMRAAPGAAMRGARALPGAALRGARALPGTVMRGARAVGRGITSIPRVAASGARAVGRGVAGGVRSGVRGVSSMAGRGVAAARALPGRVVAGARALPGRIAAAPGNLVRGVRSLPGRLRESFGGGLSRRFLVGEDIANLGMARSAGAEARAAVWAEARAPGGALAGEGRVASALDEPMPGSGTEARARIDEARPATGAERDASVGTSSRLDSDSITPREAANEVAHVSDHPNLIEGTAPNRRARLGEHEIAEHPAPEMPTGIACARHSNGGLRVPCPRGMGVAARDTAALEQRLDELMDVRLPPDIRSDAARAMEEVRALLARDPARAERLLDALEARLARRGVDVPGARALADEGGSLGPAQRADIERRAAAAEIEGRPPLAAEEAPGLPEHRPSEAFAREQLEIDEAIAARERGNTFNTEREPAYPHNEVLIDRPTGRGRVRLDSYIEGEEIVSRKYPRGASLDPDTAIDYIVELAEKYPPGARIADTPLNRAAGIAGRRLRGQPILEVPVLLNEVPREVVEFAERAGVVIRDVEGRIYR